MFPFQSEFEGEIHVEQLTSMLFYYYNFIFDTSIRQNDTFLLIL